MAFAVIETGGKQYRVNPGTVLSIEKLEVEPGSKVQFDRVLLFQDSESPVLGTPHIAGMIVSAEVIGQEKGDKIRVATYKAKKRQRRTLGHRQMLTQVRILSIDAASTKTTKKKDEVAS